MKKIEFWKVTRIEGDFVTCTSPKGMELDFLKTDAPNDVLELGNQVAIRNDKGCYSLLERVSDIISRRPIAVLALAKKYL